MRRLEIEVQNMDKIRLIFFGSIFMKAFKIFWAKNIHSKQKWGLFLY